MQAGKRKRKGSKAKDNASESFRAFSGGKQQSIVTREELEEQRPLSLLHCSMGFAGYVAVCVQQYCRC
jgi:hypothetical protein